MMKRHLVFPVSCVPYNCVGGGRGINIEVHQRPAEQKKKLTSPFEHVVSRSQICICVCVFDNVYVVCSNAA